MAKSKLLSVETNLVGRIVTSNVEPTDTTIYASFEDKKTGDAVEPQSTTLLFVLSKDSSRFEIIYADSHTTTDGITTITVNAAGRALNKYGGLSGSATGNRHVINSEIGCATTHLPVEDLLLIFRGTNATGVDLLRIGAEADTDIYLYAQNADTNKPFIMYDASANQWVFSNDGSASTTDVGGGTGTITAGDGIDITAGKVDLDLKANSGLEISSTELAIKLRANYGLSTDSNGLQVDLKASGGLEFDGGEIKLVSTPGSVVETEYTASEAITAGVPVSKTSVADKVENTILSIVSDAGTESEFATGDANYIKSCQAGEDKVAVLYVDSGGTGGGGAYLTIGTVSVGKTATWGTPLLVDLSSTAAMALQYIEDDKVVLAYRDTGDDKLYAIVATISGTVPTLGTPSEVSSMDAADNFVDITLVDTAKLVIAYRDTADSNKGKARAATFTGTTIGTWGTAVTFEAGATNHITVSKFTTDRAGVFYMDDDDGDKGKGALLVVTGTAISPNTPVDIDANTSTLFDSAQVTTNKIIVAWNGAATDDCQARVASLSGLTISYGTVDVVNAETAATISVDVIDSGTAFVAYEETSDSDGKFNQLEISGTGVTAGSQLTINGESNNVSHTVLAKVSDKDKFIICYRDEADSNNGNAEVYQGYNNIEKCIGFAQSTVSATATVSVRSKGLDANQTSLTAGTTYFVKTGGIESTNNSGVKAGVAKTTTSIDIDIDTGDIATFSQDDEPEASQVANGKTCIWIDTNDSNKCYLCYNQDGTVKTVELT